ncbi:MAG: B12-binding domain-containing radical SAM protein [Planctomycetes bacterium]|nr:B12-binding domain-containing radical SAM protein [Planctomycetota bacterium]
MKALLLYPRFPATFWSFKHALKFVRKRAALPPLGLLTVAAMLPDDWDLQLVDTNVSKLRDEDLRGADIAFIGAMTVQRESARGLIARCKDHGLKVVAGGPLFTTEHQGFDDVDHLVLDEAEITLPRFLADFERGCAGRVYHAGEYPDLRTTPPPRWTIAKTRHYSTLSLQYSRGCPFACDFCNVTSMLGRRMRTKSCDQVVAELDAIYALGWRGAVFFVDDNFIGRRKELKSELLPALIRWRDGKRGVSFHTEASIDLADDEDLMRMMVAAGFDQVFIGIESPEERNLEECGKTQNRGRDLVEDIRRVHRSGLQVQGGFILGFDHDTPPVFERLIALIQQSGIVTAMVGILQALPGTALFDRMKEEGRLTGETSGDNVDGTTNILTTMDASHLRLGYRRVLDHIYTPRNYYRRVRTFLRDYPSPAHRARVTGGDLLAFLRSSLRLGIVGRERFQYWGLLVWTFIRCREHIPLAVTLAIYGHHFRKVAEYHVRN